MIKNIFWPVIQSIDFINANLNNSWIAIEQEVKRIINQDDIESEFIELKSCNYFPLLFSEYTNIPTSFILLEITNNWSYLLTNCFLCNGYDSLMYCVTKNHGYSTLHISSHDDRTTFSPGSFLNYREKINGLVNERTVQCYKENRNWVYYEKGDIKKWEDSDSYRKKIKKLRLNEKIIEQTLTNIGINIYDGKNVVYPIKGKRIERKIVPVTISKKKKELVLMNY